MGRVSRDAAAFHDLSDGQATACRPDPEARLEELGLAAGPLRRVVAALASRLVACEGWKRLGYARLGDYARERLGCSARSLQDWARVGRRLAELPATERALVEGTLSWSKVRLLARFVTREDEAAWIDRARSQPVRALECAARAANRAALEAGGAADTDGRRVETRAWVRIPVSFAVALQWQRLRKAAPQVAGQRLAAEAVLEMVTAEVLSAIPLATDASDLASDEPVVRTPRGSEAGGGTQSTELACADPPQAAACDAAGRPTAPASGRCELPRFLRPLLEGLESAGGADGPGVDPFELDARLRRAIRLAQRLDAELGPLLRQVASPEYEWKSGFTSLSALARERLGMSPRKLRALLRVERVGDLCPALRQAYRGGHLSWFQAQLLARLLDSDAEGPWREHWVAFAQRVSARRLEEAVETALVLREADPETWLRWQDEPERFATAAEAGSCGEGRQVCAARGGEDKGGARGIEGCRIRITADGEVARLFEATLATVRLAIERETGRLPSPGDAFGAMLDHAVRSWRLDDPWLGRRRPEGLRIFERDRWRCVVPGCTSRRNLHAHHIQFRSRGGGDEASNQVALCAFHHLRGVHAGVISVRGHAPDALEFELGCRPGQPPLERYRSGDRLERSASRG